jgi:hypothetical protein
VLTDQPFDDEQRCIELGLPGTSTNLVLFTPDGQKDRIGGFSNVTFWSDAVKGAYEALKALGVEFVQEPETADWGTAAVFEDVDGNLFVLSSKVPSDRSSYDGLVTHFFPWDVLHGEGCRHRVRRRRRFDDPPARFLRAHAGRRPSMGSARFAARGGARACGAARAGGAARPTAPDEWREG